MYRPRCSRTANWITSASSSRPFHPATVTLQSLSPKLITVAANTRSINQPFAINFDTVAADRPIPSAACFILEPGIQVSCGDENALPRDLHNSVAIGKPKALEPLSEERLSLALSCRPRQPNSEFDEPNATQLHGGVFGTNVPELIGEPFIAENMNDG